MICNTIGLTTDSFTSIYMTGGAEVEEVYGAINYAQPIYAKIREITGIPPLHFTSRTAGTLTDYRIYGETMQDGTPSPDYPVDVQGVGERTENLFDENLVTKNSLVNNGTGALDYYPYYDTTALIEVENNFVITFVKNASSSALSIRVAFYDVQNTFISAYAVVSASSPLNVTIPTGTKKIRVSYTNGVYQGSAYPDYLFIGLMAPPSYIPYGYKIPVTVSNGTDTITTPVYIGAEPLHRIGEYADYVDFANGKIVRRIKKMVLTGEEPLYSVTDSLHEAGTKAYGYTYSNLGMTDIIDYDKEMNDIMYPVFLCSHFIEKTEGYGSYNDIKSGKIGANSIGGFHNLFLIFATNQYTTFADFKSYLAQQYAAGTPVTVWYVLETPIEEDPPVPIPAIPTLSGVNTITVDTTVQPSQMYIKGKIKPNGYGKLVDKNGVYILDTNGVQLTVHGQGTSN